jgi:hypothetical protein
MGEQATHESITARGYHDVDATFSPPGAQIKASIDGGDGKDISKLDLGLTQKGEGLGEVCGLPCMGAMNHHGCWVYEFVVGNQAAYSSSQNES